MLRLHNTLSGQVEDFIPQNPPQVKIYSCGPTVYYFPHIGNYRTFCFVDLLRRYLKYRGYQLTHVMNITDVDDKTIQNSAKEGVPLKDFTARYENAFFRDMEILGCEKVEHYPRATEHIKEMLQIIQTLDTRGYTYTKEGSVYFAIDQFENYGHLSNLDVEGIQSGIRVDNDEYTKENPRDFVLWKARKGEEPFWDSPYGPGRPGWHIECSAMSRAYLGMTLDIHTGAIDLIFPHHENEIAQSECSGSSPFVKYWVHSEFLNLDNEKMSKSSGNFFTLRDLLEQGLPPLGIRYALLSVHYRKQIQFSLDTVTMAEASRRRIQDFLRRIQGSKAHKVPDNDDVSMIVTEVREAFIRAMDDDLNISEALGHVFDFIREMNVLADKSQLGPENYREIEAFLKEFNAVVGVLKWEEDILDEDIQKLIDERLAARKSKDFSRADALRDQLKSQGILLEDTPEGTHWKRE